MHWDGTVTFGNLLTIGWFTGIAVLSWVKLNLLLKEFPLHRHINGTIIFPSGTKPGDIERTPR